MLKTQLMLAIWWLGSAFLMGDGAWHNNVFLASAAFAQVIFLIGRLYIFTTADNSDWENLIAITLLIVPILAPIPFLWGSL